jgi:hypothetical protein
VATVIAHPDREQRGQPIPNAPRIRESSTLASAWSSPSADASPDRTEDDRSDVPTDTDMREDGAPNMAALLRAWW